MANGRRTQTYETPGIGRKLIGRRQAYVSATAPPDPFVGQCWLDTGTVGAMSDIEFGVRVAQGLVSGYSALSKFGTASDCDSGVATDIWDGADSVTSTDVWVPPTTARLHNLTSTSTADDGDPAGTGMRTIRVYGLTGWDTAETNEDVTLDGTSNVSTANSYVIIHRMNGLTFGSGGTNAGIIKATAATDATVTAVVKAAEGQTLMAIYGVPSTQTLYMTKLKCTALTTSPTGAEAVGKLLVKENADLSTSGYLTKEKFSFSDALHFTRDYMPARAFPGPCIIKVQVSTDQDNSLCTAAFDGFLVDN